MLLVLPILGRALRAAELLPVAGTADLRRVSKRSGVIEVNRCREYELSARRSFRWIPHSELSRRAIC